MKRYPCPLIRPATGFNWGALLVCYPLTPPGVMPFYLTEPFIYSSVLLRNTSDDTVTFRQTLFRGSWFIDPRTKEWTMGKI